MSCCEALGEGAAIVDLKSHKNCKEGPNKTEKPQCAKINDELAE